MTARRRGTRVASPAIPVTAPSSEVEWPTLKSSYTPALDYRHICAYDGPVVDCPVCFDEADTEAKIKEDS